MERPRPGRRHIRKGDELALARGLLARRLVAPGRPLLNGQFGVTKEERLPQGDGPDAGRTVLRLIMKLTASNLVSREFEGDVRLMTYHAQWRCIMLQKDESFDDLEGCFYIFSLPTTWARVFCFDMLYAAEDLGLADTFGVGTLLYLGACTMPMGYKNAMGLIEYGHRRAYLMRNKEGLAFSMHEQSPC